MNEPARKESGLLPMNEPAQKDRGLLPLALVVFLGLLGLVLVFGFFDKTIIKPRKAQPATQTITQAELPIGLSLLKNPIVYQWRGSVEGQLVAKDNQSITIEDDKGNSIVIPLGSVPDGPAVETPFFDLTQPPTSPGPATPIPLEEVPLGSHLIGEFFVVPVGSDKSRIIGSSFQIVKKP